MNLYQIESEMLNCISYDPDTGEVIGIDEAKLEALTQAREEKLENTILWVKNLESDLVALKAERDAFDKRIKQTSKLIDSLKHYLTFSLKGEKFSTAKCQITFRNSEQVVIPDETKLPKKWMTKTIAYKPDKTAIKSALKSGFKVRGAELMTKLNPQIK